MRTLNKNGEIKRMKKFISILLVAVIAITCVFAADVVENKELTGNSVTVSFGATDEVVQQFRKGTFGLTRQDGYGLALNVRFDFTQQHLVDSKDWFATAIVGVAVPNRQDTKAKVDVLARYKDTLADTHNVDHYITVFIGGTKKFEKEKFDLYTSVGHELAISTNTGNVDLALAGAVKMDFKLNDLWALSFNMKGGYKVIEGGTWSWDWSEEDFHAAFTSNQFTFGVTYNF